MLRHVTGAARWLLLPVAALALGAAGPALAQGPQAVTIDSNLTVKPRPYAPLYKVRSFASVVLLAGGNGVLNLNAAGDIRDLQGNFLIRSVRRFLNSRLNVAMLDAEPAFPAPGGLTNQRLTAAHAAHLGQVIAAVRARWPGKPVWLVGTSNGTLSVLNAAARLSASDRPDGIALTSSITQSDSDGELGQVLSASPGLADVAVPTLVMWHKSDGCALSPAGAAATVFDGLTGLPAAGKARQEISGGAPNVAVPACSGFHYHGFNGVERSAVSAIAKFIAQHTP